MIWKTNLASQILPNALIVAHESPVEATGRYNSPLLSDEEINAQEGLWFK